MSGAFVSASLADLLWQRACAAGDRRAYLFLDDGGGELVQRSYADLSRRAHAVAAALLTFAQPGDRAALMFNPGIAFLDAFFGCLYAGIVAVPMMPPRPNRERAATAAILKDCRPRVILTARDLVLPLRERLAAAGVDEMPVCIAVDEQEIPVSADIDGTAPPPYRAAAADIAFLQYTSGSTSLPKGVMVSHGNLRANAIMIADKMSQDENSNFVGWAPLYHDQGLIGNVLQPLYLGAPAVVMAPNTFLQRPHLWIEAVDRYRAHTSGGPDYAFGLVAERVDPQAFRGLDLSCWQVAFNGAEPIRAHVLARFSQTLAPLGFRPTAVYPCYGLAEGTLFSTGATAGTGALVRHFDRHELERGHLVATPSGVPLVSSGSAATGLRVLIVDPQDRTPCPEGRVGEVWLAGPSIASGYWQRPEATAETFGAHASDGSGPYLRTGDLGALVDEELHVCGRIKDMIIVRGRNIYPQDLEATARLAHPAVSQGSAAAAVVSIDGVERLLLAIEIGRAARHGSNVEEITAAIRRGIRDEHDLLIDRLLLLLPGGILKTTSGKVRRQAIARAFQSGELVGWNGNRQPVASSV